MDSKPNKQTTTDHTEGQRPVERGKPRWRRRFLAVCIGLLPFLLLELGLRAMGVGGEPTDLHAGFGKVSPLFELDEQTGQYRTSLAKEQFFVGQTFPAEKPPSEFRIFCLGGSTVQGRPYRPETAFGKWLELELSAIDDSRDYRTVNCGGISYASYRLRPVLEEVLTYQPDLIVLATGHNEFLEDRTYAEVKSRSGARILLENAARYSRTVMLLRDLTGGAPPVEPTDDDTSRAEGVQARLDDESGYASYHRDDEWHTQVCQQYHNSVAEMLIMCRQAEVPVVLVRLGANLRDCPPFKSEHKSDLPVEDEQRWQQLFDEATAASEAELPKALELYERALEIDDQYPLLHFRVARILDQMKRFDEARGSYQTALNMDICPLRMIERISNDLSELAEAHTVPLIDAAKLVTDRSPDGIPGYESYIDHVHPTIGVHQMIGSAIAEQLRQAGMVKGTAINGIRRRKIYAAHLSTLSPAYYSNGHRRIGWLEGWARRQRLYEETIPVDARGYVAAAIRHLDLHDYNAATEDLEMAVQFSSEAVLQLVEHSASLFAQGRTADARWILDHLESGNPDANLTTGIQLGQLVLAVEYEDKEQVRQIVSKANIDELPQSGPAIDVWLQQNPNVREQAQSLLKK